MTAAPFRFSGRPSKRRRKKLERTVEGRCDDHAKARGWTSRKMNGLGFRSWPDRLFIPPPVPQKKLNFPGGRNAAQQSVRRDPRNAQKMQRFWVEFKREGEEPTPAQKQIHRDLRARGEAVHVVDNFGAFLAHLDNHEAGR